MQGLMWGTLSMVICLLSSWPTTFQYLQFSAAFQHLLHLPVLLHALPHSSALSCTLCAHLFSMYLSCLLVPCLVNAPLVLRIRTRFFLLPPHSIIFHYVPPP